MVDSSIFPRFPMVISMPPPSWAECAADLIPKELLRQEAPALAIPRRSQTSEILSGCAVGPAPPPNRPVNTILSIAIGMTTLTSLLLVLRIALFDRGCRADASCYLSRGVVHLGADAGLLMFPMVDLRFLPASPITPLPIHWHWSLVSGFLVWGVSP